VLSSCEPLGQPDNFVLTTCGTKVFSPPRLSDVYFPSLGTACILSSHLQEVQKQSSPFRRNDSEAALLEVNLKFPDNRALPSANMEGNCQSYCSGAE
jgi:hypothetical protein